MGPIHAFCMQVVANGILQLYISNEKEHLICKPELLPDSVTVQLGVVEGEMCVLIYLQLGGNMSSCWQQHSK